MNKIIVLFSLVIALSSCELFHRSSNQNLLFFDKENVKSILTKELVLMADTSFKVGKPSKHICPDSTQCNELTKFLRTVRKEEGELPLVTRYYFGEDSIVQFVKCEWTQTVPGLTVQERERLMIIESKRFDVYVKKLNEIANQLQLTMGEPIANDGEIKKNKTSLLDIYNYSISFEKDNKHVDLKLAWSPKRGARIFRVWAKVYWLK
jgi:hypothetical protein